MKILTILCALIVCSSYAQAQSDIKFWTRQFGTGSIDDGYGVATDPFGNCIVVGEALGRVFGTYYGSRDIVVAKYDTHGNLLWGRQRGTSQRDCAYGVATDSAGNIYVTGYTGGGLDGNTNAGGTNWDIFLMKFNPAGDWLWTRQFGAANADEGYAVATDAAGNVYLTGYIRGDIHGQVRVGSADVIVCKYNSAGTRQWTRLFGSVDIDQGWAIACDPSANVIVSGYAVGPIEGNPAPGNGEIFLAKYDTHGDRLWLRQWGTVNAEHGYSLATDAVGNIYLSGYTAGELYSPRMGGRDVFLAKFDPAGNQIWGRQFGTDEHDQGWGVAMGPDGNIYLAGQVAGSMDGNPHQGGLDVFLAKYNPMGTRLWLTQVGSAGNDYARGGVAVTADGIAFLAGTTSGSLDGQINLGSTDLFAMKFGPRPLVSVDAGPDREIYLGESTLLEAAAYWGLPPYTFSWIPAEGLDNPALLQPTASPVTTTTYTLTVTDALNDQASDSVTVSVSLRPVPGDFDEDRDVDLDDFAILQSCLGQDIRVETACAPTKLADGDVVDAVDFNLFVLCFSGADIPGDPDCLTP